MKRECVILPLDGFIEENQYSLLGIRTPNVELRIDAKSAKEICAFLALNKKRFIKILITILLNHYNDDLYRKEKISEKTKDITAMKFTGKSNPRIYCKEFHLGIGGKKIIMIHLLAHKNFQKANDKRLKPKLESIADYEYDFKK